MGTWLAGMGRRPWLFARLAIFLVVVVPCILSGCGEAWTLKPLVIDGRAEPTGAWMKGVAFCAKADALMKLVDGSVIMEEKGDGMTLAFHQTVVYVSVKPPVEQGSKHINVAVRFLNDAAVLCGDHVEEALRFAYPEAHVRSTTDGVFVTTWG